MIEDTEPDDPETDVSVGIYYAGHSLHIVLPVLLSSGLCIYWHQMSMCFQPKQFLCYLHQENIQLHQK